MRITNHWRKKKKDNTFGMHPLKTDPKPRGRPAQLLKPDPPVALVLRLGSGLKTLGQPLSRGMSARPSGANIMQRLGPGCARSALSLTVGQGVGRVFARPEPLPRPWKQLKAKHV